MSAAKRWRDVVRLSVGWNDPGGPTCIPTLYRSTRDGVTRYRVVFDALGHVSDWDAAPYAFTREEAWRRAAESRLAADVADVSKTREDLAETLERTRAEVERATEYVRDAIAREHAVRNAFNRAAGLTSAEVQS